MSNDWSDEQLLAFVDGEADPATAAALEVAMAADAELAARVRDMIATRDAIAHAFDDVLEEDIPEPLLARLAQPAQPASVIDLAARREARTALRGRVMQWTAMAACLGIGVVLGGRVLPQADPAQPQALVLASAQGTVAGPALADALASQTSGSDRQLAGGEALRPVLTFTSVDGALCRQFTLSAAAQASNGLACRDAGSGQWRILVLAGSETAAGTYRTVAGPGDTAVDAAVDALIAGEPLDAAAERAALAAAPSK